MVSPEQPLPNHAPEPEAPTLIREITLRNFLSFGSETPPFALRPLNILIGPNGAGKSNFIEAFALLQATRGDIDRLIRRGGGVDEWLWKPAGRDATATIDVLVSRSQVPQDPRDPIPYHLAFGAAGPRFQVLDEAIGGYYVNKDGASRILTPYVKPRNPRLEPPRGGPFGVTRALRHVPRESVDPSRSILAQRRDPQHYPELTDLGDRFEQIHLYREWIGGRSSALRAPQRADMPNDHLLEDGANLGMVLNRIQTDHSAMWDEVESALHDLLDGFENLRIKAEAGSLQIFLREYSERLVPAMRLSDGTLRLLCLLAILCDPTPPPLVVIEEPALGLHPDAISILPRLLRAAAERTQLIVTTHSDSLVDAFNESPEDIVVIERALDGTRLRRLDREALSEWLKTYRLGQLWGMGVLGGNRW